MVVILTLLAGCGRGYSDNNEDGDTVAGNSGGLYIVGTGTLDGVAIDDTLYFAVAKGVNSTFGVLTR